MVCGGAYPRLASVLDHRSVGSMPLVWRLYAHKRYPALRDVNCGRRDSLRRRRFCGAEDRPAVLRARPRALESLSFFRADVAQLAEHITRNDGVLGSIPSVGSSLLHRSGFRHRAGCRPPATRLRTVTTVEWWIRSGLSALERLEQPGIVHRETAANPLTRAPTVHRAAQSGDGRRVVQEVVSGEPEPPVVGMRVQKSRHLCFGQGVLDHHEGTTQAGLSVTCPLHPHRGPSAEP